MLGVFDGGDLSVWDLRKNAPQETIKAHKGDAYTLDINPINSQLVISGGEDHNIRIWDRRMLSKRLYTFEGHKDTIMRVEWSPHDFNIFCSGALDHKVMVWDILRVGCEVPKDDTNSGPTELLVINGVNLVHAQWPSRPHQRPGLEPQIEAGRQRRRGVQ